MATELDFLRDYLSTRSKQWTGIANDSDVARRAIAYIVSRPDRDPRHSTISKLMAWVAQNDPESYLAYQGRSLASFAKKAA
jgi:hypothetical protein